MVKKLILVSGLVLVGMGGLLCTSSCGLQCELTPSLEMVTAAIEGDSRITLHYFERFPYMWKATDGIQGLTAEPVAQVFQAADIPFSWQNTPPKRQIYLLEENQGRDCLLGWFKKPSREECGAFTLPIYQDYPTVALARVTDERLISGGTVSETLSTPALTLLVKAGFSYGSFLDAQIAECAPVCITTTVGNVKMLRMLQAGRADYFFIAPEEAEGLFKDGPLPRADFKLVHFADMPPGEKRYLWCSHQVEESIIEQLNVAIRHSITETVWTD
ncbi:MAG TPA: amino acid ABC transporter substrate-binding protein [Thermoflexia bacterium]|nr:amino acid ABC transporter substrate-binding protein [Thermoflexia bacterium]